MLGLHVPEPARSGILEALTNVGCYAALRGTSLRISPHLHTTDDDVECLFRGLATAVDAADAQT